MAHAYCCDASELKAVSSGYSIHTSIALEPSPPPEPSLPAPSVPLHAYETETVSSTISFATLELSSFEDAAFNASFRANFTRQVAAAAGVNMTEVEIVAITSGSTEVESAVHFSALSAGNNSADVLAASFVQLVNTTPGNIFATSNFEQFGEFKLRISLFSKKDHKDGEVSTEDDQQAIDDNCHNKACDKPIVNVINPLGTYNNTSFLTDEQANVEEDLNGQPPAH
eukprot:gene15588-18481_t